MTTDQGEDESVSTPGQRAWEAVTNVGFRIGPSWASLPSATKERWNAFASTALAEEPRTGAARASLRPAALQAALDEHQDCGKWSTWTSVLDEIDSALDICQKHGEDSASTPGSRLWDRYRTEHGGPCWQDLSQDMHVHWENRAGAIAADKAAEANRSPEQVAFEKRFEQERASARKLAADALRKRERDLVTIGWIARGVGIPAFRSDECIDMLIAEAGNVTSDEVPLLLQAAAAKFLWQLLDDVDSLDDSCRDDDKLFRERARALQKRRFEVGDSDGYEVIWKKREQ